MTFCLALVVPGMSLAVADTRVSLSHDSDAHSCHDGPDDLTISVSNPQYEFVVPFRFRKIQPVSNGWVSCAGHYLMGKAVLDLLSEHATDQFGPANQLLQKEYTRLVDSIQRRTGFSKEQLSGTVVLGAPYGLQSAAWLISFDPRRVQTNPAIGDYVANWPQAVPVDARCKAEKEFVQEFQRAAGTPSIAALMRPLIRLVATAARLSTEVGSHSQVGVTVGPPLGDRRSYYLQGDSLELLSVSESQLSKRIERLP